MKPRSLALLIAVLAIAAGAWFFFHRPKLGDETTKTKIAIEPPSGAGAKPPFPTDAVESFYVGISSLDVEENERAGRLFEELSKKLPDEPAIWTNLGLARMRLGDLPGAAEALNHAAQLAPQNGEIAELQAMVDESQGDFPNAIARLRALQNPGTAALYRLTDLLSRSGADQDAGQQRSLLARLRQSAPNNPVIAFNQARFFARVQDAQALEQAVTSLDASRSTWTSAAARQMDSVKAAVAAKNFRGAATQLAFLQNQISSTPAYQAALAELGMTGGSVGRPMRDFQKYRRSENSVADADRTLHFVDTADAALSSAPSLYLALPLGAKLGANILFVADHNLRIRNEKKELAITSSQIDEKRDSPLAPNSVCAVDLKGNFLQDLALADGGGLKIWIQDRNGLFNAFEPPANLKSAFAQPAHGVWAFDFDADGDLDLLVARDGASPQLFRNNGDGTFTPIDTFAQFPEVQAVCSADFDHDGNNDLALLDAQGRIFISWNERAGSFTSPQAVANSNAVALTYGDLLGTGENALVALDRDGAIHQYHFDREKKTWSSVEIARWTDAPNLLQAFAKHRASLFLADLDNNGAVDLIASGESSSAIWLNDGRGHFQKLAASPAMFVSSIADLDGDGLLDLVGVSASHAIVARTLGTKNYHWQSLQTRTLAAHADSRINSGGIGGEIQVRAGPLLASAPITSPNTHIGLGDNPRVGVARIVWPNGVAQVEFELQPDQEVTAVQRLKGSCPWVFTRAKGTLHFVKDFIWRSPLGMRINSQETAGVDQTTDWILIPGKFLDAEKGAYEIRITAELWEAHFFDHVSLRVVDHPDAITALVDERFVPAQQPKLAVIGTDRPHAFRQVRDQAGRDETEAVAAIDDRYANDFPLGQYQGVAQDHWLEFELPADAPVDQPLVLVGDGWIYPTDSSLNVAISQGRATVPHDLSLEAFDPRSGWQPASSGLGFPAGKNKTVVIPFPPASLQSGYRRFRLRTNLEIYWNRLAWAIARPNENLKLIPTETLSADLRYRGFTRLPAPVRNLPDLPHYELVSGYEPRWRDLEGYYTRFGDVRELLAGIDDRYVIMNAGDEMILRFAELPPPPAGWTRDFVLVGDGWVKDGDFNTANSATVHPLPTHQQKNYRSTVERLEDDPVFQRHAEDWQRFHTRYLTPAAFSQGLMKSSFAASPVDSR